MVDRESPDVDELLEMLHDQQQEIYRLRAERDSAEELLEKFIKVYTGKLPEDPSDPIAKVGGYY